MVKWIGEIESGGLASTRARWRIKKGVIAREGGRSRLESPILVWTMSSDRLYFVYILASKRGGTLYVGVTNDVARRIYEHQHDLADGFTKRYEVHRLVYFETHQDIEAAIKREKRLKKWKREWKIRLIEETNPGWIDLYSTISTP